MVAIPVNKVAISVLVVLVLATQLIIGFTYHAGTRWPFISYPMYSGAKFDRERLDDFTLRIFPDATKAYDVIRPEDMGMGYWIFRKNIILPVNRNSNADKNNLTKKFCARYRSSESIRLELYDIGAFISKSGVVFENPKLITERILFCNSSKSRNMNYE